MTTKNAYATLAEYKLWVASRGLSGTISTDTSDDSVIETLLVGASRYIDQQTGRHFYPIIKTRYYDVPTGEEYDPRVLRVDDDLLEVLTLTNGDGVAIPSTEYNLKPKNDSAAYGIRLIDNSTYIWASDGAGDTHDVIQVLGVWGYHNRYNLAWLLGSTANEAMDATETAFDVTSGTGFAVGNIIRFDNELGYVSAVATNTLTTTRGENESTAATHDTAIDVDIWQVQGDIKMYCMEIVQNVYGMRSGQSSAGRVTVTAAGVVIRPEEVPPMVAQALKGYRNILL